MKLKKVITMKQYKTYLRHKIYFQVIYIFLSLTYFKTWNIFLRTVTFEVGELQLMFGVLELTLRRANDNI